MQLAAGVRLLREAGRVDQLQIDNGAASARLSLFGGQVLAYTPRRDGRERLWLSPGALLNGEGAIRGGVPVCWPWFGSPAGQALPAHGYVRKRPWRLEQCYGDTDWTELLLSPEDSSGPGFTGDAALQLRVRVGSELELELISENRGSEPFALSCALHSYFRVADVLACELEGLSGDYSDKTRDWALLPTPRPYRFSEETDRIHLQPAPRVLIREPGACTSVESAGHDSVVVWNPWTERAAALADMRADDHRHMLCVESAVTQGLQLQPGQRHTLLQRIG